jgi:hypothetical protein
MAPAEGRLPVGIGVSHPTVRCKMGVLGPKIGSKLGFAQLEAGAGSAT